MHGLHARLAQWSEWFGLAPNVLAVLAATLGVLAAGSMVRLAVHLTDGTDESTARLRSLGAWWKIVLVWTAAVLIGRFGVIVLMAAVSAVALREYLGLVGPVPVGRTAIALAYAAIPVQYGCIALERADLAMVVTPTLVFIAILAALIVRGRTTAYAAAAGRIVMGPIVTVYLLSFAATLLLVTGESTSRDASMGWFVLVVLLTMASDIVQALVGRAFGRHRVLPAVSPGKTWEGLIPGVLAATALSAWVGPSLTPMSVPVAAAAGLVVSLGGFFGDLNISAIKRDRGVEDSGTLLAEQGGMLDRVDALCFSAPLLFLYARIWLAASG